MERLQLGGAEQANAVSLVAARIRKPELRFDAVRSRASYAYSPTSLAYPLEFLEFLEFLVSIFTMILLRILSGN